MKIGVFRNKFANMLEMTRNYIKCFYSSIKVVNNSDENNISYKQALIRDSPALIISIILQIYIIYLSISTDFQLRYFYDQQHISKGFSAISVVLILPGIWMLLELITMLTNKKRRALHDYIGRTVVVRTNIATEVAEPSYAT